MPIRRAFPGSTVSPRLRSRGDGAARREAVLLSGAGKGVKRSAAMAAALLALSGPVSAAGWNRVASKAAQNVALARLAPEVCDGLVIDPGAIGEFMASVELGEQDLTTRYAGEVGEALRGFREAVDMDEDLACSRLDQRLGQAGLGLIRDSGQDSE